MFSDSLKAIAVDINAVYKGVDVRNTKCACIFHMKMHRSCKSGGYRHCSNHTIKMNDKNEINVIAVASLDVLRNTSRKSCWISGLLFGPVQCNILVVDEKLSG